MQPLGTTGAGVWSAETMACPGQEPGCWSDPGRTALLAETGVQAWWAPSLSMAAYKAGFFFFLT